MTRQPTANNHHIKDKETTVTNEPITEITANELRITIVADAQDVLIGFPYRTGQSFERAEWNTLIIDLNDWTGVTTDQERFLDANNDVLHYDIYSTVG